MMNPDVKAKWLEALRSDKYGQTKSHLRDENGFCCLGVLCDISGLGHWGVDAGGNRSYHTPIAWDTAALPDDVKHWAGLTDPLGDEVDADGLYLEDDRLGGRWTLSSLNDMGFTFAQIADMIEARL